MKRMWQNWLAIVTLMTVVGTASAQTGWNQPSEIGSYQSIMSRAGFGNGLGILRQGAASARANMYGGSAMHGGMVSGGAMSHGGGAMMQGGVIQGGAMQGGMISGGTMSYGAGGAVMQGGAHGGGGMMQGGAGMGMSGAGSAYSSGAAMQGAAMNAAQAVGQGGQGGAVAGGTTMGGAVAGGTAMGGSVVNGGAVVGPAVMGSTVMGGNVGSSVVGGTMATGQVMALPGTVGPMAASAPVITSAPVLTSQVDMGSTFVSERPLFGNSVVTGAPAYSAPMAYSTPVYQQSVVAPVQAAGRRARANYTAGVVGLFFQRDYEDNRFLAQNAAGATLFTNDADQGSMDGFGVNLGSRNANGSGFEVGYWALNPGSSVGVLQGGNVYTVIQNLDQLTHVSSGRNLYDIYANSVTQTVVRDTDITNLEFNLLRNGGTFGTRKNRRGFYELLGGFRWFQFDESLQYAASIDTGAWPGTPSDFYYNLEAQNRLLGLQLGARNEYCLSSKLRFFSGVKGGIFNNNIRTVQNITDINGEIAQVNSGAGSGRPFSYTDEKNDVAFLGELDFGILYNLSARSRIRLGYRALGISGVALAADQMPFLYNDPNELSRANSNGNLLLGGGYYGLEFCF